MNKETLQLLEKHFDTAFDTPEGIKKLRELILTLAMQGKLVQQDPKDRPASELLKEIEAEKAKLIKAGKIKKQKELPEIKDDEIPYELPKGWVWTRLGEVSFQITDGTHHTPTYVESGIPFLSVKDMSSGVLKFNDTRYISPEEHEELKKRCYPQKGDLLLTKVGTTGIPILVNTDTEFSIFVSVALIKFSTYHIIGEYLVHLVNTPLVKKQSADGTEGVGNKNLVLRKINAFNIPLPPLAEQKRIVEKIDQLMVRCDELEKLKQERDAKRLATHQAAITQLLNPDLSAVASLREQKEVQDFLFANFGDLYTVKENVAELRKAILQLAVMGKLVKQDPKDQPASELLKEIEAEKARLVKAGKIKKQKELPEIKEDEVPFELPEGWIWTRLGEVGILERGKSKHRPRNDIKLFDEGIYPFVQTGDVSRSKFSNYEIRTCTGYYNEIGLSQSRLFPRGTLCITIAANIAETGFLAFDSCVPDSVVVFDGIKKTSPSLIKFFIETAKNDLETYAPSTAQKNINLEILNTLIFPLPPLAEQKRIVEKIDQLMVLCDSLEKSIDSAGAKQSELLNAVMAGV